MAFRDGGEPCVLLRERRGCRSVSLGSVSGDAAPRASPCGLSDEETQLSRVRDI